MILQITTTHQPTSDLGYLMHKHPDKFQSFELSIGKAHVFYPEMSDARASICLLLDIDPIEMVRGNASFAHHTLGQYVNDRPYVSSSFMSNAISKTFSSALNGKCKDKPELVTLELPFEIHITSISVTDGGENLINKFFEPLGYQIQINRHTLDPTFPEWGESSYFDLTLKHCITTSQLLSHLYVLLPTLDLDKHYFVGNHEIEKLLEKGEGWLKTHPERDSIIKRYLKNINHLTRNAFDRLNVDDEVNSSKKDEGIISKGLSQKKETLHEHRLNQTVEQLKICGAQSVMDLGCGEGKLIKKLIANKQFSKIVGMDVSYKQLLVAKEKLKYQEMSAAQKERIQLFQGSITYKDNRMKGFDAATVVEVIEHLDPNRLKAFEHVLFENAQPKTIILTTPNKEYNIMWEQMDEEAMRHPDHRFEWTRSQFYSWAKEIKSKYHYHFTILPIGEEIENIGAPSQMAIFTYEN